MTLSKNTMLPVTCLQYRHLLVDYFFSLSLLSGCVLADEQPGFDISGESVSENVAKRQKLSSTHQINIIYYYDKILIIYGRR